MTYNPGLEFADEVLSFSLHEHEVLGEFLGKLGPISDADVDSSNDQKVRTGRLGGVDSVDGMLPTADLGPGGLSLLFERCLGVNKEVLSTPPEVTETDAKVVVLTLMSLELLGPNFDLAVWNKKRGPLSKHLQ